MYRHALKTAVVSSTLLCMAAGSASALDHVSFDMVVSAGASTCLPNASAKVRIESVGTAEGDDAAANPMTAPVQTYHLGLWFNSPLDAQKAGCAGTMTPFNGEHNAGIQVLNTSNFPDTQGPLFNVQP